MKCQLYVAILCTHTFDTKRMQTLDTLIVSIVGASVLTPKPIRLYERCTHTLLIGALVDYLTLELWNAQCVSEIPYMHIKYCVME